MFRSYRNRETAAKFEMRGPPERTIASPAAYQTRDVALDMLRARSNACDVSKNLASKPAANLRCYWSYVEL